MFFADREILTPQISETNHKAFRIHPAAMLLDILERITKSRGIRLPKPSLQYCAKRLAALPDNPGYTLPEICKAAERTKAGIADLLRFHAHTYSGQLFRIRADGLLQALESFPHTNPQSNAKGNPRRRQILFNIWQIVRTELSIEPDNRQTFDLYRAAMYREIREDEKQDITERWIADHLTERVKEKIRQQAENEKAARAELEHRRHLETLRQAATLPAARPLPEMLAAVRQMLTAIAETRPEMGNAMIYALDEIILQYKE
ncbi:TPA: hypothetical protein ACFNMI_002206 [Neisseria bacilliformis]